MIYALIDTRADDFFMTKLVWGDVQQVANAVFKSCDWIFESLPNMSMEDIENEYDCSLDAYRVLSKFTTLPVIQSFSMYVEDMEVLVAFAVEGFDAFYQAFNQYKDRREAFEHIDLIPIMDETEENLQQLNAEFRSISSGQENVVEYRYLHKADANITFDKKVYS